MNTQNSATPNSITQDFIAAGILIGDNTDRFVKAFGEGGTHVNKLPAGWMWATIEPANQGHVAVFLVSTDCADFIRQQMGKVKKLVAEATAEPPAAAPVAPTPPVTNGLVLAATTAEIKSFT